MAAEPILSQNLDSKNKRAEPKKKSLKKKRSIRFSRVPSRRFVKSPIDDLGSDDSSLQQSSSVGSSDSLPNYTINSSNSFIPNKGGNEFDDANSMISSSSGSTGRIVQPSEVISSDDDEADTQNSYSSGFLDASSKAEGLSEGRKKNSLRNGKVLIKNVSFKPKRASRENEVNSYVNRATCSSIIKDSRFPERVELQESDKVCRYHHCSLHGHCHEAQPLVKKFSFRRRQQQVKKPQMNTKKSNIVSNPRTRFSADKKELKKPEITESVGASDNKNTLKKNMKSKAFIEGQDSLDLDSNLKGKSSKNIPSDIALILSSEDTNESRKDSNESRLNVKNEESTNNQVSSESTKGGDFKTSTSMKLHVPQSKKGKEISMWHMIHKQIISSLAEEDETHARKPVIDEEKQVEYTKEDTPNGSDQGSINNVEEGSQELEIRKLFAIKLVREAIENILLPEVQDQSSETQSDTTEDQQLQKDYHQEDNAENHVNHSTNSDAYNATSDVVAVVACTEDSINEPANDKPETKKVESEKKSPGNWSSLKKWIVLQRFVKALEKLRKYKPSNPRDLPLESDPKGEKVSLRRQTVDGRKNSEEWMLDYAIRQVVSQLAPNQKKKVTLLVKAFETIVPPQDDYSTQVSWPQLKGERRKSVRKVDDTEDMKQEARGNGADVDVSMVNDAHFPEKSAVQNLRENVPLIEESQHEINSQKTRTLSTKPLVHDSEPYLNLENRDEASRTIRSTTSDIDVKSKVTENTESEKPKTTKENLQINNVAKESTARNEIYTESKPKQTLSRESSLDSRLDKENYLRMWHMIYQHVASNIASKVDLLGGEEDKQVKDFNTSSDIATSTPRVISMGERKFSKSDAVKLIQEAVDEILLQDDDVSDTQSVTTETTPDMFLYERNRDEVLNKSISNTSVLNEEYVKEFDRSDSGVSIEETKPTIPKPKNWRKLKRLILLKRSIKAMEKSRKLKSLQPRKNLPLISDAEPEKVDLKHQMVNERIKAEQWMLDYAVQNIVSELTPARKRRVAMLVEAFEAVVPLPEI